MDFSTASAALRRVCGGILACLTDGLETGSVDEAGRASAIESELELSSNTCGMRNPSSGTSFGDMIDMGDARVGTTALFFKTFALNSCRQSGAATSFKEDLNLVTDVTTSMSRAISTVKDRFEEIITPRANSLSDAAFGLGTFGDERYDVNDGYSDGSKNILSMTKSLTAVREGVAELDSNLENNPDTAKAGLTALYEMAT